MLTSELSYSDLSVAILGKSHTAAAHTTLATDEIAYPDSCAQWYAEIVGGGRIFGTVTDRVW
jgi:hypothetical protein